MFVIININIIIIIIIMINAVQRGKPTTYCCIFLNNLSITTLGVGFYKVSVSISVISPELMYSYYKYSFSWLIVDSLVLQCYKLSVEMEVKSIWKLIYFWYFYGISMGFS